MKNNSNSLIRQISTSAFQISRIIIAAMTFVLVCGASVNAQIPASYGKPLIVNGQLRFVATGSNAMGSTYSTGQLIKIMRFEPLDDKRVKLDYITQMPDKNLALRLNGVNYAMCYVRRNPQDGSNKNSPQIRFSGSIKISSSSPTPALTVAQDEKKDDNKKAEENKAPAQLFPVIVLLQDKSGVIRLMIQTDETTLLEYQVHNIWELFILIPKDCQNDFYELFKYYSPTVFNNQPNTLNRVYNAISKSVPFSDSIQNEYQQLIDDLSSDVYIKRVAAANRIQKEGSSFLAFAQKLDMSQLDPEARVRLASYLSNELFVSDTDDVDDMALLFSDAFYAFIPLLESDNPALFAIAQKRIKEKLGDSFDYDPSAPQDVRAAKIQELKTTLGFPRPNTIKMDEHLQQRFKELAESIFNQNATEFKF